MGRVWVGGGGAIELAGRDWAMQNIATDNDCHIKKKKTEYTHFDAYEILVESRDQSTCRSHQSPLYTLCVTHLSYSQR